MVHLPAGYALGPPGYGYENYMRGPLPPRDPTLKTFPDGPIGVPLSHGHPSFIGRAWEDAAFPELEEKLVRRQASATHIKFTRERTTDLPLPDPKENMLNPHSTVAEREYEARVVFRKFDADGSDYLDLDEFVRAMNYLGVALTYEDAKPIYAMFDEDGSGQMDEEEFVRNFLNNYT
eukprot:TRINITY_DN16920_c0_g1_i1.p2 TRINITY_DN16920_c0_g1~~TRINITY_DN16920_c0_g1_i1.p2  ORF type:complete len:191 (+),score=88.75 TRINITY_DN16920_c0_g1_i1:43-573(+)